MAIYQPEIECMDREELKKLQSERLVWQVNRMYERVELFRKRMDEAGLKPSDIKGVEDLHKLPFSYKQDLRDYYPYGLFAESMKNIVRVHASSGTTGKQIVVGYTRKDLDMWADCVARMMVGIGQTDESFVQVSYGYGLFTGGLGAHDGATRVGATVIPTSAGNTSRQIQTMIDFGSTCLCCTPSYAMYLGETIEEMGVKDQLKLQVGIFGAEPWTEDMRKEIEDKLNIKAFDIYGLSEIMGPGVSFECEHQCGMHINEDMFIAEIIDPDTGEVLPYGEKGELVFTTLTKEAMPLIRYRTKDLTSIDHSTCECGRTLPRISKFKGRTDDMKVIRGVNVFPTQVETALLSMGDEVAPHYMMIVDRENNLDVLTVMVEVDERYFSDEIRELENLRDKIGGVLKQALGIAVKVKLVEPKTIARSEGKAKRVIDNRNLN